MIPENTGWSGFFLQQYLQFSGSGLVPGRVVGHEGVIYQVESFNGRRECVISGHFSYIAAGPSDYPAVGDWVLLRDISDSSVIEKVLERKSRFSRRSAGRSSDEQVIAANIDIMFITMSLDGGRNFNLRAIERYLVMVNDSGAEPVLLLNKCDLCMEKDLFLRNASSVTGEVPILLVSALTGEGMDKLSAMIGSGVTGAFTGPSGAGKSALVNCLLGKPVQKTGELRSDDLKGRHTTTSGGLFFIQSGGMVIDTPGLRELKPYGDRSSLDQSFPEIAEASDQCRFRDCRHVDEPGCAVREMMLSGVIEFERYQNYITIRDEMDILDGLKSEKGKLDRKAKEKSLSKILKQYKRDMKK